MIPLKLNYAFVFHALDMEEDGPHLSRTRPPAVGQIVHLLGQWHGTWMDRLICMSHHIKSFPSLGFLSKDEPPMMRSFYIVQFHKEEH